METELTAERHRRSHTDRIGWHMSAHGRGDLFSFILLYATLYAGFGVVSPFLPTLLQSRGLQPDQIGLVLALSTGVRLVSGPLAGRIADLYSALRVVFACCAVAAALTAFGYLPARVFRSLLAVSVIYAAMLAPLTTIADALALAAARPLGTAKCRFEYGWVRGAGSAAFIVGSVLAGQAIVAVDLDVIIWGGSAFLVAAAVAATMVTVSRPSIASASVRGSPYIRGLLRLRKFRLVLTIAALVLGSHAMHDSFAVIRWREAGVSPPTASLLWSESVGAEVLVFVVIGPRLLDWIGPTRAMMLAAAAGVVRWTVMAITANVGAMALIEPLHGVSFALLHLASMRLLGQIVPPGFAATAQAIYGTVAIGAMTSLLTFSSGTLYGHFGAGGFWAMAGLCLLALPFIAKLKSLTGTSKN
jgi:MFS transporter, PPP family, 3-phenylpropionic acid transporter